MGIPMYMRIKDYVKKQIEYGTWEENQLIPTEAEFAKQFGVSRITVTSALRQLSDEGVIYRVQGKGSYVSKKKTVPDIFDMAKMFQLDGVLEHMNIPGPHKCESLRLIEADDEIAELLQINPGQYVYEIIRSKYVEDKVINTEKLYLPQNIYLGISAERLKEEHLAVITKELGITTGKTLLSLDPVICDEMTEKLLHIPQGTPLMRINLEIYDSKDKPIAYEELIGVGKKKKIVLNNLGK